MQGITIKLIEKVTTGTDPFGRPIEEETEVEVENVLVSPASAEDVINELSISGKHIVYNMAIPKGDTHVWENTTVEFFGRRFRTVGIPKEGIEELIPLDWNKQISVEVYE